MSSLGYSFLVAAIFVFVICLLPKRKVVEPIQELEPEEDYPAKDFQQGDIVVFDASAIGEYSVFDYKGYCLTSNRYIYINDYCVINGNGYEYCGYMTLPRDQKSQLLRLATKEEEAKYLDIKASYHREKSDISFFLYKAKRRQVTDKVRERYNRLK